MANERHMRDPYVNINFLMCCYYYILISRVKGLKLYIHLIG